MTIKRSLPFYLIGFYPVALILGTLISEIITLFLIALYIYDCINDKKKFIYNDPIIYFLMIIWIYLLFNLIYSIDFQLSFYRSIFFIRYPLLILSITHFLTKDPQKCQIIFSLWMLTIMITIIDLYIQFFFGENMLGFKSPWDERLSGFFNQELKVAHLLIGFFLPAFSFFFQKKENLFLYIALILYFLILILTNERANIIRGILVILIFLIMIPNFQIKIKVFFATLIMSTFVLMVLSVQPIKNRFVNEISAMNTNNSIQNYIILSNYGPHYLTSIEVFKENKLLGTGIKTFRKSCHNVSIDKYYPENVNLAKSGCSTHPHQIYFEILSDLGLIGLIIFISFFGYLTIRIFKNYLLTKNLLLLSCGGFFVINLIPFLPTGSFFTSFGSTIFFINISLIYYCLKKT
jgi:O-antigen ligase